MDTEQTIETIRAMRFQEDNGYATSDWTQITGPLHYESVDAECRDRMAAWFNQIVDLCTIRRETIEIALNNLDRFLCTPEGSVARKDRNVYRLACMSALYTAVKINEPSAMDPRFVSRLSQGAYSASDIEAMESTILGALNWRINPPTAMSFVRSAVELIPEEVLSDDMRQAVVALSQLQTELAMSKHQFMSIPASTVAFSAVNNSLESLGLDLKIQGYMCYILAQAMQIDNNSNVVMDVQRLLYESVVHQPTNQQRCDSPHSVDPVTKETSPQNSAELSPRSISATR